MKTLFVIFFIGISLGAQTPVNKFTGLCEGVYAGIPKDLEKRFAQDDLPMLREISENPQSPCSRKATVLLGRIGGKEELKWLTDRLNWSLLRINFSPVPMAHYWLEDTATLSVALGEMGKRGYDEALCKLRLLAQQVGSPSAVQFTIAEDALWGLAVAGKEEDRKMALELKRNLGDHTRGADSLNEVLRQWKR